ncbi:helix-turn-helix domain-containing protein [Paenibacillus sp. MCAF20]
MNSPSTTITKDEIRFDPSFPMTITQTRGVSPTFQRLHWHKALEINYIREGSGYYLINGNRYDFQQGDIVLIHSNDLHRAFEAEGLVMTIVMFDPAYLALEHRYDRELLLPFRELGASLEYVLDRDHPQLPRLQEAIAVMYDENARKEAHYETIVRAQLIQFVALAGRYFMRRESGGSQPLRGMETMREVLHAIEDDYARPWTLRSLSELAHLSPSRFSTLFTQVVGTSPMDYLIQLRLAHAASLVRESDMKMIEVAEACGFRNLSNFNRLFKHYFGLSPSSLRRG